MIAIRAGRILTPVVEIAPGVVIVEKERISSVGDPSQIPIPAGAEVIDASDKTLVPGFIDTHTHGRDGHYFGETVETTSDLCRNVVSTGVTSLLPTLSSLLPLRYSLEMILNSLRTVRQAQQQLNGAEILGIHMEGPFLSREDTARGSQLVSNMRRPSVVELNQMIKASDATIRKMTIAPELEGALDVVHELARNGVVPCAGHSTASFEEVQLAIEAGLRCATHTFNGMRPLHHRRPGLLGAILTSDQLSAELIADCQHVSVVAMEVLLRCKGTEGVHLITDNTKWAGLPDGIYKDGSREIVKDKRTARVEGGTLVGSVTSMNQCVANMVNRVGCTESEAVRMASLNAARLIGCDDRKGSIESGKDADLAIIDSQFQVHWAMVRGCERFRLNV